ncbi:MAG: hypothetical protein F6K55_06170 [Moorea sp. SIO4A3]|nr:hypothetical protein [Moorena sp. SIO4A3]
MEVVVTRHVEVENLPTRLKDRRETLGLTRKQLLALINQEAEALSKRRGLSIEGLSVAFIVKVELGQVERISETALSLWQKALGIKVIGVNFTCRDEGLNRAARSYSPVKINSRGGKKKKSNYPE